MMIRLGLLDSDSSEECFYKTKMEPLTMEGIAWRDETLTNCVIGGIGHGLSKFHVKFPRDADGKVDLKNGRYLEAEKSALKVKYEKKFDSALVVPSSTTKMARRLGNEPIPSTTRVGL